jgi:hypothetical protein
MSGIAEELDCCRSEGEGSVPFISNFLPVVGPVGKSSGAVFTVDEGKPEIISEDNLIEGFRVVEGLEVFVSLCGEGEKGEREEGQQLLQLHLLKKTGIYEELN